MPKQRRRTYRRRRGGTPWGWLAWLALLAALLVIYFRGGVNLRETPVTPRNVNLLESNQKPVVFGTPGWDYRRTLNADLDNDGTPETIEVLARVAQVPGRPGQYQWDDGQPWQVYIRDGQQVTHIYSRWVQLGRLEVFVTDEQHPRIGVAELQGAGFSLYAVAYSGPKRIDARQLASLPVKDRLW